MSYTAESYPAYTGSGVVAGKKFLLYVAYADKWNLVGGMRDTGLSISSESIDGSSKDDGGWGSSAPGIRNWSSSASLVVKTENEGDGIIENWVLNESIQEAKPALRFAYVNTVDKTYFDGWGVVNSYGIESSHTDVMTKSIEIAGCGAIVKKADFNKDVLDATE